MPQGLVLILPSSVRTVDLREHVPAKWQAYIWGEDDKELHLQSSDASWYLTITLMEDTEGCARGYSTWDNIDDVLRWQLRRRVG